jgi:hypothetical protein
MPCVAGTRSHLKKVDAGTGTCNVLGYRTGPRVAGLASAFYDFGVAQGGSAIAYERMITENITMLLRHGWDGGTAASAEAGRSLVPTSTADNRTERSCQQRLAAARTLIIDDAVWRIPVPG